MEYIGFSQLIIFFLLIALGYLAGTIAETRHYRAIKKREHELIKLPAVTIKNALEETALISK